MSRSGNLDLVLYWIQNARWAASGGNSQPWNIEVKHILDRDVSLKLSIDPEYRLRPSPMDVSGLASIIALGCYSFYLEQIAARYLFSLADYKITENGEPWDWSIDIRFSRGTPTEARFSMDELKSRWTDRSPYFIEPIDATTKQRLDEIMQRYQNVRAVFCGEERHAAIPLLRSLEYLRWRHTDFRDGLFEEISFKSGHLDGEEARKIPLSQLGVPMPEQLFLKLLKNKPGLRRTFDLGAAHMASRAAVDKLIKRSGEVVFLTLANTQDCHAFELGRCFQELWLECNRSGLSFQPIGLPLIAFSYWRQDPLSIAAQKWREDLIKDVSIGFGQKFQIDLKQLVLGFRIGKSKATQLKSPRRDPKVILDEGISLVAAPLVEGF